HPTEINTRNFFEELKKLPFINMTYQQQHRLHKPAKNDSVMEKKSISTPPTRQMIQEVNHDLRKLSEYKNINWYRTSIYPIKSKHSLPVKLNHLKLDGIIFGKLDASSLNGPIEVKSHTTVAFELSKYRKNIPDFSIHFTGSDLQDAKFEDMICLSFNYSRCTLKEASFIRSILSNTHFEFSDLCEANLSFCFGASCHEMGEASPAVFLAANLTKANLYGSNFREAFFSESRLDGATLDQGNFEMANFTGASCINTEFDGAYLQGADFKNANMLGAKLKGAHFDFNQFTKEQVLTFHYEDPYALSFINAIYEYMEKNKDKESKHKEGFERARQFILSFIHHEPYNENGQNLIVKAFLEKDPSFFGSTLRTKLLDVQKNISETEKKAVNKATSPAPKSNHY
ncbi:MAG TPA: pentapeptide repeat-containing protein, partial [Gammaproteobacteria bacterium]|nr:pentapeptide repeat-containing protein [Gammaproteobacteria bacterium]